MPESQAFESEIKDENEHRQSPQRQAVSDQSQKEAETCNDKQLHELSEERKSHYRESSIAIVNMEEGRRPAAATEHGTIEVLLGAADQDMKTIDS